MFSPLNPLPPLLALLTAWIAAPRFARRLRSSGWIDLPRADRHSARTVPRAGGVAWLTAFVIGALSAGLFTMPRSATWPHRGLLVSLLIAGAAFVLGRLDDQGRIGSGRKWLLQTALLLGALLAWWRWNAVAAGAYWPDAGAGGASAGGIGAWILLALWLQTALQVFDNLDTAFGTVTIAACAVFAGRSAPGPFALPAVLAGGAAFGVLLWNLPPARIYFGNSGSLPLSTLVAFWLAASGMHSSGEAPCEALRSPSAAALLPLLWPMADLAFVSVSRWRRGVPPWVGGRDHTTHRLARALGSDGWVAVILGVYAALAIFWAVSGGPWPR